MVARPTSSAPRPSPEEGEESQPQAAGSARGRPGRGAAPATEVVIQRIPWSQLGPAFVEEWGRPRGKVEPEHLEILGPTGCGKSFLLTQILIERVRRKKSAVVYVATKAADKTVRALGWPITDNVRDLKRHDQVVFWPRTSAIGARRKAYVADKVQGLLDELWHEDANVVLVFDEIAFLELLSGELKDTILTYQREGRSHGITLVMGKQRAQGVNRDMHSESDWKIAFQMNDRSDAERVAELFGDKRVFVPILMGLDRERREFLIQHKLTGETYISWVDKPLSPAKLAQEQRTYRKA